ncbi:MAG: ATP-dependent DNA helicase RecG [Candidatus Dojkabacteria bacterium]|nr:ATP-dependent DNA helicase RecG [Candidatus Dojkabacteria bacterium]
MNLTDIKGISPRIEKLLKKLEIHNIEDLLLHPPIRYIDRRKYLPISDIFLTKDENWYSKGKIKDVNKIKTKRGKNLITAIVEDNTSYIKIAWFNSEYLLPILLSSKFIAFSGIVYDKSIYNPKFVILNSLEEVPEKLAKIEVKYPETAGINSATISKIIKNAIDVYEIKETLPNEILEKENLVSKRLAIQYLHFPENEIEIKKSKERLAFEEIYSLIQKIKENKINITAHESFALKIDKDLYKNIVNSLNYELTASQKEAIHEIFADISRDKPMHRLINGDVGSGKTILAIIAASQVSQNNLMTLVLAPTEILANQHFESFNKILSKFNIPIILWTSSIKHKNIQSNSIVIGTHALIHHTQNWNNVGLVIIDEQHKFGVKQREILTTLKNENKIPHSLSMSATPIPRTVALTFFGDIDVSFIEKPTERKKIITRIINSLEIENKMIEWIKNKIIRENVQAYVVCPLIEETSKSDLKSVQKIYEHYRLIFGEDKVGLLHGKMKAKEKDEIIKNFIEGKFHILVSTTVIEVGINNPNATIMIIQSAERFGLAQLHQIRGRVGRGSDQSYCFLIPTNYETNERLKFFEKTENGYELAEYDLLLRGPGEVYGTLQSGIPNLRFANILDKGLISQVKKYIS